MPFKMAMSQYYNVDSNSYYDKRRYDWKPNWMLKKIAEQFLF